MTKPTFTLEQQHEMARERYPAEYAFAGTLTGKKRQGKFRALRDRAVHQAQVAALPEGARCGSCRFLMPALGHGVGQYCDIQSDSDGYVVVKSGDVCPDWEAQA